jgi:hypothetical protein
MRVSGTTSGARRTKGQVGVAIGERRVDETDRWTRCRNEGMRSCTVRSAIPGVGPRSQSVTALSPNVAGKPRRTGLPFRALGEWVSRMLSASPRARGLAKSGGCHECP